MNLLIVNLGGENSQMTKLCANFLYVLTTESISIPELLSIKSSILFES